MKPCIKCFEVKPLGDFYPHKNMADGHLNMCKECSKRLARKHRIENLEAVRAYDRKRAKDPKRVAATIYNTKLRRAKGDGYMAAHSAVSYALKKGTLIRQPCQMCGTTKHVHAHHDDYSKPLEVMWLCPVHHRARHDFLAYIGEDAF